MIIAIAMQKGGTGKTTTAAVLCQAAARRKCKVLAVDMDPQRNLTSALGVADDGPGDSYKLLTGARAADQIHKSKQSNIDIIPGSEALSATPGGPGSARRLQEAIRPISALYDVVLIDTPPTAGVLQYNALQAAHRLIIPINADGYSADGLYTIIDNARQIQKSNPALQIAGILYTRYDPNSDYDRQLFREIINTFCRGADIPYLGTIRTTDKVKEAARDQVSLYTHAPRCTAAADYMDVFHEVTEHKYT